LKAEGYIAVNIGGVQSKTQLLYFCDFIFEPCQKDHLSLDELAQAHEGELDVIAISLLDSPKTPNQFLEEHPIHFPIVYQRKKRL
jgi:hypothetical protein